MTNTPEAHPEGHAQPSRRLAWIIGGALVLALALIATLLFWPDRAEIDSRIAEPPTSDEVVEMDIAPLDGDFVVEAAGLAMPLEEMSVVDDVINPPGFDSAYVVRDYADPGDADQMSVVALHSLSGGDAPGNKLIDVDEATATVDRGQMIEIQGHNYEITRAFAQGKDAAAADDGVWEDKPGKLLVFTCLQKPDGSPSTDNVIIEASLVEEGSSIGADAGDAEQE